MNKTDLRHLFLKKRLSLSVDDVDFFSQLICRNLFTIKPLNQKRYFHIFLPIAHNKEINTWPIINALWEMKKKVIVPISDFKNFQMANFFLTPKTKLEENNYGIPEPIHATSAPSKNIQVVILPLLAFDNAGFRVGYGKGFYDKFLNCLDPHVIRIGVSFFEAAENIENVEEWDEKLHFCVTPAKVYEFW